MPDAPRVGGITPFLKIAALAEHARLMLGAALRDGAPRAPGRGLSRPSRGSSTSTGSEPLFNERLEIQDGRMLVPTRPGLGFSLTEQARAWTRDVHEVGKRP